VSDLELVRVIPSAEDEVNVACFHPFPGAGLVYGTKVCFWMQTENFHLYYFNFLETGFHLYYLIDNPLLMVVVGRKA
jgi:hypothetical protein